MTRPRPMAALVALALLVAVVGLAPAGADGHSRYDTTVVSHDGLGLAVTVYKPASASASAPVPMILHSHGWGGSRTSAPGAFSAELGRGFGVLSFDQRGFGDTGGRAAVQRPELEGRDVITLLDYVAGLDWVATDPTDPTDPVVFAMGGSYGGGYQLVGALTELRDTGRTRFDALAPEITWYDLPESLAPSKVVRTAWVTALYASGLAAHEDDVHLALAYGAATGQWPDGTVPGVPNLDERFARNGPSAFTAEGIQLDIPALIGQGSSDNLFNLNQGWKNFERTLTDTARERSIFIGYNGGHALPNVAPLGYPMAAEVGGNADTCSPGGFGALRMAFFEAVLGGDDPRDLVGGHAYSVMTADGRCVRTDSLDPETTVALAGLPGLPGATVTTTGAGAPQHLQLAAGPLTVAGIPLVEADVTSVGVDQRVFFALSVGSTPATARVIHNNVMPLRELLPVQGVRRTIELAGMAADVGPGEFLYLTVTPVSDMFAGHGSARTPGTVVLANVAVHLPIVP